nr:phosphomevalonate kinase, peroxisomal-like [Tanacetum cinerariifolium]
NYINKHGLIVALKDEVAPGAQHGKGNDQWDTLKQYMVHWQALVTSGKKKELYLLAVGYLRCKCFTKSTYIVDKCLEILGEPRSGRSSTSSMVCAVKKWQKSDPQNSKDT